MNNPSIGFLKIHNITNTMIGEVMMIADGSSVSLNSESAKVTKPIKRKMYGNL